MSITKISWTDMCWNPCTGCSKISCGCQHCYAEPFSKRLKAMGHLKYKNEFTLTLHPHLLQEPYHWKKSRKVFVNSMSDLFHEKVPFDFIQRVFKVMNDNPHLTFQVLTKRANILEQYSADLNWTENIWMGVTVESDQYYDRIDSLRKTGAKVKFLSCEPLLTSVTDISLAGIDWVIVAGESGPHARPIQINWVREIRNKCLSQNIPFFFKQWHKRTECELDGMMYKEFPKTAKSMN